MVLDTFATEYLEISLNDLRQKLIDEAYMNSQIRESSIIEKIDVEAAINKIVKHKKVMSTEFKIRRLTRLVALTGICYSGIGMLIFIFQNTVIDPKKDLGLILIGIGMSITMGSYLLLSLFNNRKDFGKNRTNEETKQEQYLIVQKWKEIEEIVSYTMDVKIKNFQYLLASLIQLCDGKISIDELANLVSLRNKIVHEDVVFHKDVILKALVLEDKIISILKENKK